MYSVSEERVLWEYLSDMTKDSGFSPHHLHKEKYLVERVISINTGKAGISSLGQKHWLFFQSMASQQSITPIPFLACADKIPLHIKKVNKKMTLGEGTE